MIENRKEEEGVWYSLVAQQLRVWRPSSVHKMFQQPVFANHHDSSEQETQK